MHARVLVAIASVIAIAIGIFELSRLSDGLRITRTYAGATPVTIFQPQSADPAPVVVIAHGFAGSQQLMQPFATTLARNGYIAVTFDFLGHGRNPVPMAGDITTGERITSELLSELGRVAVLARKVPECDGRVAVLGHSMASDIVIRYAQANPDVEAATAVSVFSRTVTANSPRNLLVVVGALEPSLLKEEGRRIVSQAAGSDAAPGITYGNFADGTARRLVFARGVEHIGVLYSVDSLEQTLHWMNAVFGRQSAAFIDDRGRWLGLLFLGIIALAWPLSALLPTASPTPVGANLPWKPLLVAAFVPALLTPFLLWKVPTDFLPVLLGDYLALHFFIYGALTAGLVRYFRRRATPTPGRISLKGMAVATAAIGLYEIVFFGVPINAYVFSFAPIASRIPLIAAVAVGSLVYFSADEWLTRGQNAPRGAYILTKLCFLSSLALAVALNPMKLFFLLIIVPAILLLFGTFGLISHWAYRATRHPLPGAFANAALFAWAIAVTFPMIIR